MDFAWKYCKPIDEITADKKLKLQHYELDNDNWLIIQDLLSLLQVSLFVLSLILFSTLCFLAIQEGNGLFLKHLCKCRIGHSRHGQNHQCTQSDIENIIPPSNSRCDDFSM
jgi:hypothetical protein